MSKSKRKRSDGAAGPLDASPSHLMHRVLQVALDIYAEETGPGAPTQRQFAVLAAVAQNEGLTQTDLVHATGIDRSTLADLVARMMGKDLLARERSTTDGRANTVSLSAKGREALDAARPRVEAADKRILSLLSGGKRSTLMKVLGDLAHAGETAKEAGGAKAAKKAEKARKKAEKEAAKAAKPKKVKAEKAPKPAKTPKPAKAPKAPKAAKAPKAEKAAKPVKPPKAARPEKAPKASKSAPTAKVEDPAAG